MAHAAKHGGRQPSENSPITEWKQAMSQQSEREQE